MSNAVEQQRPKKPLPPNKDIRTSIDPPSNHLPSRPHKRSWSGGINLNGVQSVLQSFSPPIFQRKRSVEDETLDFHYRNQQFLKQHASKLRFERSYRLESPRARLHKLALTAIGDDDWERNYDEEETCDGGKIERLELVVQNAEIDSGGNSSRTQSSTSNLPDHDYCDSSRYSLNKSMVPPSINRSEVEQKLDIEREVRDAHRRSHMELRLTGVLDRQISERPADKQQFIKEYMKELEKERESLIRQWKSEFQESEIRQMQEEQAKRESFLTKYISSCLSAIYHALATAEVFFSNLPLTIGAVALSWTSMGVVWFKFMEENIHVCKPVHYHSPLCNFPEFPGCFDCDIHNSVYQIALYFHDACCCIGGCLAMSFLLKSILAWQVVADQLSNPTTATPVGVVCITLICVFAGRGIVGEVIVIIVSTFHCFFAFWFLYMAIFKFKMLPDPSWFPCTVGISYAAVKTWLYFPSLGRIIMCLCMVFFFGTFFISLIRVSLNQKIAAPVCWIQLSAPSISLFALTIVSQPSKTEEWKLEHSDQIQKSYHDVLHEYYMPLQHFMMILSLIGMVSALQSLWSRWDKFRRIKFSPAHVAFSFPILSHTNGIQAYRRAVASFSSIPRESFFHIVLFSYWITWLIVGTVVNLILTYKFMVRLPEWTNVTVEGETAPPAPSETLMSVLLPTDFCDGPFVSSAVLQANEAGALMRVRRGTEDYRRHGPYVRTRQVTALGFDPTLDDVELRNERAALLDWVSRNAPRTRHRTLSIPMMLKLKNEQGEGIYGTFTSDGDKRHKRSWTLSDAPLV
jgi:hypothetical protein